jgi:hypothetical protein
MDIKVCLVGSSLVVRCDEDSLDSFGKPVYLCITLCSFLFSQLTVIYVYQ